MLTDQKSAVVYFITKLDIEMLDEILDEKIKYQNFKKDKFLFKLQCVFENFQNLGDTYLEIYNGKCNGCDKSYFGTSFIGNKSKNYIDLIIKFDQGKVIDIFECSNFKNVNKNTIKSERQYLEYKPF